MHLSRDSLTRISSLGLFPQLQTKGQLTFSGKGHVVCISPTQLRQRATETATDKLHMSSLPAPSSRPFFPVPRTAVSPTLPEAVLGCLAGSYACVLDPVPDLQCLNIWHTLKHTGTRSLVSCPSDRHCTTLVCLFTAFLVMLPVGVIQLTSAFSRSVAESNISLYTSFWHVLL